MLPGRLAKTKALQDVNRLKIALKGKELDLSAIQAKKKAPEEAKEVRTVAVHRRRGGRSRGVETQ